MAITFRKVVAFFSPKPRKPLRARRSPTPDSIASTTTSRDPSVRGSSNVLNRLKSWFERTKAVAPEGFFILDVGKQKARYEVPITYLSHEDLQKLLDDSVAEFGHTYVGALQLACEEEELKEVLKTIKKSFEGESAEGERQRLIAGKDEKLH